MYRIWVTKVFPAVAIFCLVNAFADDIPPEKLNLIEQAVTAMDLKPKLDAFIENGVAIEVERIRNENPGLPDSVAAQIKSILQNVYSENFAGDDGLYARLYGVFDKYLTEEDLKFVIQYHGSDGGQRFSQVIPRIVADGMAVEKQWSDQLKPVMLQKLAEKFGDSKFHIDLP